MPGTHGQMVEPDYIDHLAAYVREYLAGRAD
jgi:hypothetical protein